MKKLFLIIALFSATTAFAQDEDFVNFTPYHANKYKNVEKDLQLYVSDEVEFTHETFDTSFVLKKGKAVETIKNVTEIITIRSNELGKITGWDDSNKTVLVTFDTENKKKMTIPFSLNGSGGAASMNNAFQIKAVDLLGPVDGIIVNIGTGIMLDDVPYKISKSSMNAKLQLKQINKDKSKTRQKVSKGVKVK